jgi:hypothetical protein
MIRSLNTSGRSVPNLVVAQRVLNKMVAAARHYIADETGEAMVGLIVPGTYTNGVPTLYVLDTISPDDSAVRQMHTFQQGDELQYDLFEWLNENWRIYREKGVSSGGKALQAKWDVPLAHLGDWHKQPGYMIQPSGGDLMTALNMIDDTENEFDFLLVPIVTLGHPSTTVGANGTVNFLTMPQGDGSNMRVDFWYIDRSVRMFQPIMPAVYPDHLLPGLPDYPWHLVNPDLMSREFNRLQDDGLFTSVVLWNADGEPPLEICFMTARMGADRILIIATPWDYPHHAPHVRVAPFVQMDTDDDMFEIFEEVWEKSEPVNSVPGWKWSGDQDLLTCIQAVESALGIKPRTDHMAAAPASDNVSSSIPTEGET